MINKKQIETILKINGFSETTPDDQIRTILLSARYSKNEVDAALLMLKQDPDTNEVKVNGLHKIFYSDTHLKSGEISSLLGIDIDLNTPISRRSIKNTISALQFISVWFFSVVIAVTGILFYMYLNQIGLFHPSAIFSFM